MKDRIHQISDKAKYVEVYHTIMRAAKMYNTYSPNIPRVLIEVSQHIHGRFDAAAYNAFKAANNPNVADKIAFVREAKENLFYQYNSLEYLVQTKGLTIGAANTVIDILSDAYNQLGKWETSLIKLNLQEEKAGS